MESLILALFVCLVLALITKYLSIPAIPFYILAGVLLGKAGGGLLTNNEVSQFFSEIGLLFLLFFMGIICRRTHFHHFCDLRVLDQRETDPSRRRDQRGGGHQEPACRRASIV